MRLTLMRPSLGAGAIAHYADAAQSSAGSSRRNTAKRNIRALGLDSVPVEPRRRAFHRGGSNEIVRGTRAITADTALRLSRFFGTSERFWLNLQSRYDLEIEKDRLGDRLRREVRILVPARSTGSVNNFADTQMTELSEFHASTRL